jgi:hypothetical protein
MPPASTWTILGLAGGGHRGHRGNRRRRHDRGGIRRAGDGNCGEEQPHVHPDRSNARANGFANLVAVPDAESAVTNG